MPLAEDARAVEVEPSQPDPLRSQGDDEKVPRDRPEKKRDLELGDELEVFAVPETVVCPVHVARAEKKIGRPEAHQSLRQGRLSLLQLPCLQHGIHHADLRVL